MATFTANEFTGGENNWLHPTLLKGNQAVLIKDAKPDNGKLVSIRLPRLLENATDPTYTGHYGSSTRSTVKWYRRNYWSNDTATQAPYYGGDKENLGIPYPSYNPVLQEVGLEEGVTGLTGTYKYCWCYVNVNGWESAPCAEDGELWSSITVSNKAVRVVAGAFPEGISYIKVYRTQDDGGNFYCVGEIDEPNGTLIDNTDDSTLVMLEAASSFDNYPPPDGGKYLCESGGVFFLAVGSRLYFSVQGNPHAYPRLNFVGLDDAITGIVTEFQGVLVFTANNAYRIIGAENSQTITKTLLPGNVGCQSRHSIAHLANAPIWLSPDGICVWDGNSVTIISQRNIKTEYLSVKSACSADDIYFLFTSTGAIIYDRRNGGVWREMSFTCDYAWYDGIYDCMYLQKGNKIYLYGTGENSEIQYISPYIGGTEMTVKRFHEMLIVSNGTTTIKGSVDGEEKFNLTLEGNGRKRIKLPFTTVGRNLQLNITSTGELSEIAVTYT